jgi:predicted ATPase
MTTQGGGRRRQSPRCAAEAQQRYRWRQIALNPGDGVVDGSSSWELRAAMSTARLWCDQGKRDEARELLAPVYGWFTEGFDTLDLKEAKLLLEALAA